MKYFATPFQNICNKKLFVCTSSKFLARSFPANISQLAHTYHFKKAYILANAFFSVVQRCNHFCLVLCAYFKSKSHFITHISSIAASHMMISVQ